MNHRIGIKTTVPLNAEEITRWTEEAAFFNWLNRMRYVQPGNEKEDWFSAERELQETLRADPLFSKARSARAPAGSPSVFTPLRAGISFFAL